MIQRQTTVQFCLTNMMTSLESVLEPIFSYLSHFLYVPGAFSTFLQFAHCRRFTLGTLGVPWIGLSM